MLIQVERMSDGTIVLEEFRNNGDAMESIFKTNPLIQELYDAVVLDYTNEKWNTYIRECIATLEQAGWEVAYV